MTAHFFDIDTLITVNSKVWIIDKLKPQIPLAKLTKSEFNLLKKGVYKKDNIYFEISGQKYWLNKDLLNKIKVQSKNKNTNISNLSFSMVEFMSKELVENGDFEIHIENIQHLKNTQDDIYVICSKNTKENYGDLIKKLDTKLASIGLTIKSYYFISETFYNKDKEDIINKKLRILIQHLIGLKTENGKLTEEQITKYNIANLYDTDYNTIKMFSTINDILKSMVSDSDSVLQEQIKDIIKNEEPKAVANQVTFNKVNRFITTEVELTWLNIIKTFEGFKTTNYLKENIKQKEKIEDYIISSMKAGDLYDSFGIDHVLISQSNLENFYKITIKFKKRREWNDVKEPLIDYLDWINSITEIDKIVICQYSSIIHDETHEYTLDELKIHTFSKKIQSKLFFNSEPPSIDDSPSNKRKYLKYKRYLSHVGIVKIFFNKEFR